MKQNPLDYENLKLHKYLDNNLIGISATPQSYTQLIDKAIQIASSELINDQSEGELMNFFKTASAKKVIDASGAKKLLEVVDLKA